MLFERKDLLGNFVATVSLRALASLKNFRTSKLGNFAILKL